VRPQLRWRDRHTLQEDEQAKHGLIHEEEEEEEEEDDDGDDLFP
jgi:hypothetical protein